MGEAAEPIKDLKQLEKMKEELKKVKNGEIFYLVFEFGLNSGLRISDILKLKVKDVLNDYICITEQKTGKHKKFPVNKELRKAINEYLNKRELNLNDFLFKSVRNYLDVNIHRSQVGRIFKKAAKNAGIKANIATHSMRKTFGYHYYKRTQNLALLQKIFNHSAPSVTLRYIGLDQEQIDDAYIHLNYTKQPQITVERLDEEKKIRSESYLYGKMRNLEHRFYKKLEDIENRIIDCLEYVTRKEREYENT